MDHSTRPGFSELILKNEDGPSRLSSGPQVLYAFPLLDWEAKLNEIQYRLINFLLFWFRVGGLTSPVKYTVSSLVSHLSFFPRNGYSCVRPVIRGLF